MSSPLLDSAGLPRFTAIRAEHIGPAIETILAENQRQLDAILANARSPSWESLIEPLEAINDRLRNAWSTVAHLNAVMNSEALREAYHACLPKITEYYTGLNQNERLFQAIRSVRDSEAFPSLSPAQQRSIEYALRDFRLAGVALPKEEKGRFKANARRLAELASRFEDQLLDATHGWRKPITDPARLTGLPPTALRLARQAAEEEGVDGWLLTLDFPSYHSVMTYAEDRDLRREIYEAWTTRASDAGPDAGRWDNLPLMEEILALRHEQARLLGLRNYAELSLQTKMAQDTDEVLHFLEDLAGRSRAHALAELAELQRFAREADGIDPLESWDLAFCSEKLRQHRFRLSAEDLRPYFPVDRVMAGLFAIAERLYGIRIQEQHGIDVWHPDVHFYEIRDAEGLLRGQFYTDLYARAHKRGGAWMDECRVRWRTAHGLQTPVAYLTCNFSPPAKGEPALLTHEEVLTVFHEFGHGLHHLLTRVDWPGVSGINGVPWDAVELPSQLMENWAWERPALDLLASHYQTGGSLPEELYQPLRAGRTFQTAMQLVRQLELALFDFRLHLEPQPPDGARIYRILDEVRDRVAVLKPPTLNRFPNSFAHIFAGGYAAGYYSYLWAEVLSADAFSRFEEEGILNPQTGQSFLGSILEKGGSEDALALFEAFRGRKPSIEPLLRQCGLAV